MAIVAKAAEFIVPALTTQPEYAALVEKRDTLLGRHSAVKTERREIEKQIRETPAPAWRRGVAELLDEASDSSTALRAKLAELTTLDRDIEAALEVLRQRLAVARSSASKTIIEACRPEYGRRVAAIARALEAVATARGSYDDFRDQLEREDISWGGLGPISLNFLGEPRDGHIPRFVREAKEANYYA
ncbi:hypothetical protein [Mesorhizobium sp. LjNodule214]|uniref:hypothetical protein n=1 Tax=Mesorhizobium sp. LjNodule214 TaxID=3342252 RepID=UPI003ED0F3B2